MTPTTLSAAPTASTKGLCPTIIQKSRTPRHENGPTPSPDPNTRNQGKNNEKRPKILKNRPKGQISWIGRKTVKHFLSSTLSNDSRAFPPGSQLLLQFLHRLIISFSACVRACVCVCVLRGGSHSVSLDYFFPSISTDLKCRLKEPLKPKQHQRY